MQDQRGKITGDYQEDSQDTSATHPRHAAVPGTVAAVRAAVAVPALSETAALRGGRILARLRCASSAHQESDGDLHAFEVELP
ncbi:hypothetical protein GCM10010442_66990 [Kitasatospora kifunensis]|uniref:Uncharacterized protein n=1 Tax=Kitasatospora kifunensis TaxID=58351 RepID=A0A7W7RAT4_KITKI|nr:hypothetical protein [Kitasatospora kifunensis]